MMLGRLARGTLGHSVAVQSKRLAAHGQSEQRDAESSAPSSDRHEVASNWGEALVAQSRSVF